MSDKKFAFESEKVSILDKNCYDFLSCDGALSIGDDSRHKVSGVFRLKRRRLFRLQEKYKSRLGNLPTVHVYFARLYDLSARGEGAALHVEPHAADGLRNNLQLLEK